MENARAYQKHQDLIIGNTRALIHCFKTVEKIYDLALIEVRDRGENRAAKRVLHEGTESFLGIQSGGRAQKRMLLPPVDSVTDDVTNRSLRTYFSVIPRIFWVTGCERITSTT
jgi:hypothetical protein